ncbi:Fc.00g061090.m01.CDS01 [Cosmosporella sp. VM-42]
MAKFTFPVPGRKKQPPQVMVTAPATNKAQRILGQNALNIDAPRSWDDMSNSGISVSVSESTAATSYGSTARGFSKPERGIARSEREWGEESEILPRHLRMNGVPEEEEDFRSDMSTVLRKRQSSSTMRSWYDRSKQPLAISQQTSASAMAKGLPSKAHKMLDIDHAQTADKSKKKKPAKLDFSHFMSRNRGHKKEAQAAPPWNGPLLAPDHVMKSPSIMSEFAAPTMHQRGGRLRKVSTKESLRSMQSEPAQRPATSGSNRRGQHHLNGLPNLYEHYEQMSFRQVMEGYEEPEEEQKQIPVKRHPPASRIPPVPKIAPHLQLPSYHDQRIISQYAHRNLPQTPQTASSKPEQSTPTDCGASISSRHTRTSKASKRTDRSFQESDLLEKSVLSLSSSDSEEDSYVEPSLRSPASARDRRPSDASSAMEYRPTTSRTIESAENKRLSRSSKGSKRTSFAPASTYLTIPNGHGNKLPTITDRSSSGSSVNTVQELAAPHSPASRQSTVSNSSANTTMTWQSKPGFGVQEARAITMLPAQGPVESDSEPEQHAETSNLSSYMPDTLANSADQPTPPLSPSSVDFYIRSAHSSIDGHGSHNRFMAVTRQEEMLLAALRHKRQIMRETILSEFEDDKEKRQSKGHKSKGSQTTITEENLDLDFPAPPTFKDRAADSPSGNAVIGLNYSSETPARKVEGSAKTESPAPNHSSPKKSILKTSHRESSDDDGHERILLYLDRPIAQELHIEEGEPSPDLSDFMEYEEESSGSEIVSEVLLYSQQRRQNSDRASRHGHTLKARSGRSNMTGSSNKWRASEATTIAEEAGVPRPDSPISPEGLGAPPPRKSTVNKKTARLSAVGPARWGNED